jgi:two-component system sensor histidine kinase DegS
MIVNDYPNWEQKAAPFADVPYSAVMGAPLQWRDQILGGIIILDKRRPSPFGQEDVWLLKMFADLATIAIKNAELMAQVTAFSEELEGKVQERTAELVEAKEDVTRKAEQLRALLARTMHLQEEERSRIARDMHDGVVQLITAARYELRAAKVASESGSAVKAKAKFEAVRDVLTKMEQEIRRAIYDLTPPLLNSLGLVAVLQKSISTFQEFSGITARLRIEGTQTRLDSAIEVAVFRLVEESLHNVATHAQAQTAFVTLRFQPDVVCVAVQDDGQGFDYRQWMESRDHKRLGLLGMRERVAILGGDMDVASVPNRGTTVTFRLPNRSDNEAPAAASRAAAAQAPEAADTPQSIEVEVR